MPVLNPQHPTLHRSNTETSIGAGFESMVESVDGSLAQDAFDMVVDVGTP